MINFQKPALRAISLPGILGPNSRHSSSKSLSFRKETFLSQKSYSGLEIDMSLPLMVTSIEAALFAPFHSRLRQHNILLAWNKQAPHLSLPIFIYSQGMNFLAWCISNPALTVEKLFLSLHWKVIMTIYNLSGWGNSTLIPNRSWNMVSRGNQAPHKHFVAQTGAEELGRHIYRLLGDNYLPHLNRPHLLSKSPQFHPYLQSLAWNSKGCPSFFTLKR